MRASLRGMISRSRRFAIHSGIVFYFAWLGNALAAEAEEGRHHLNWTDFTYRTIAFVIVVGILVKLLRKPIVNFLNARREEIRRLLAELETKTAEVRSEYGRVQARLTSLEAETKKIVDELIAEGEAEKKKIIEAAHREAEYIQQQAQMAIEQEVQAARDALKNEIADQAVAAAQELLQEKIETDDHRRLVHEFMRNVVEAK